MKKAKLFIENFLVYGVGGIISKIIPLVMVPIITRLMPNSTFFGISDMSNTIISFASAFAVMGMYDSMYRMFFERDEAEYKKRICSTTLLFTIVSSAIVFLLLIVFRGKIAVLFLKDKQLINVVYLSAIATLVSATNQIIAAPTRMQNKRKVYLIANTVSPLLSYGIAIPLLLKGYYVIALPLSSIIAGATMEITFYILNGSWFSLRLFDRKLLKQLLVIAIPLLPNFLIYWVFNSCDKLMITNMMSVGAEGIYSIGSKLGHASQLIYTAFAGGWQYFAFSTMKEKNQIETNSKIYEYLGVISFVITAFVAAFSYWLYGWLFPEEYISGYVIVPYLFLAPLLLMLYQVGNSQFTVIKKTWPGMIILSSGAVINVLLNRMLIPILGIEGAAIATLAGYIISCVVDILVLYKCRLMKPNIRFLYTSIMMAVFLLTWRICFSQNLLIGIIAAFIFSFIITCLYRDEIRLILSIWRKK